MILKEINKYRRLYFTIIFVILIFNWCEGENPQNKPNILLISVDDLNDWVGCLGGHPQVKTPNIDYLASKGVLFTNAHAQTAICNPSRTSIMTSLYPSTTGIYFNSGRIKDSPAAEKNVVLTKRFEREGYAVIGAGKLFHHHEENEKNIKYYAGDFGNFGPLPDKKLSSFTGVKVWDWGPYPSHDEQMPDYKIAKWATRKLGKKYDSSFFLAVGFYRPHVPMYAPRKWFNLYPLKNLILPVVKQKDIADIPQYGYNLTKSDDKVNRLEPTHEWVIKNDQWKNLVQSYLASISFVDDQIGRVMDALENSLFKDNTYVVLFGDHGFHLGEKDIWGKQTLWERSTRVPLILIGPSIPKGRVCNKPVQLLDIYPTLLELTGHKADPKLEGHSIVKLLKYPEQDWPYKARSCFGPGNYAICSERYRYIHYNDGSEELYDHESDPHEWNNIINNQGIQEIIKTHKLVIPQECYLILGSGSTGHRAYSEAEEKLNDNKKK